MAVEKLKEGIDNFAGTVAGWDGGGAENWGTGGRTKTPCSSPQPMRQLPCMRVCRCSAALLANPAAGAPPTCPASLAVFSSQARFPSAADQLKLEEMIGAALKKANGA